MMLLGLMTVTAHQAEMAALVAQNAKLSELVDRQQMLIGDALAAFEASKQENARKDEQLALNASCIANLRRDNDLLRPKRGQGGRFVAQEIRNG